MFKQFCHGVRVNNKILGSRRYTWSLPWRHIIFEKSGQSYAAILKEIISIA